MNESLGSLFVEALAGDSSSAQTIFKRRSHRISSQSRQAIDDEVLVAVKEEAAEDDEDKPRAKRRKSNSGGVVKPKVSIKVAIDHVARKKAGTSFVLKLKVPGLNAHYAKTVALRRRFVAWDIPKYKIKFRWTPFYYHNSPTPNEAYQVYNILKNWLYRHDGTIIEIDNTKTKYVPAHGAEGMTVDALVKVYMSQATSNENALTVQETLIKKFTYTVDGEEKKGSVPNYHKISELTVEEFTPYVARAGLGKKRADNILSALKKIKQINTDAYIAKHGSLDGAELGDSSNAPDFVPGLLSLDFLDKTDTNAMFNWYCDLNHFAVKSTACLMEFNYGLPICAVDTHVANIASFIAWVPEAAEHPDQIFMHLDARLPDELKHPLHQLFWHHSQKCGPCKRKENGESQKGDSDICPIAELIVRRFRKKSKAPKPKFDEDGKRIVKVKVETGPKMIIAWSTYKSVEAAARKGYVEEKYNVDDDFGADKSRKNWKVKQRWKFVGVDAAMARLPKGRIETDMLKVAKKKTTNVEITEEKVLVEKKETVKDETTVVKMAGMEAEAEKVGSHSMRSRFA